ncbi:MAG: hypothetical protein K0S25_364 [Bacillus sp. (in: firmicutes)]|jgi:hypothetical protein|nr:hypothetical protein [Bacillus sp. (in: firmicutes)]
MNDKLKNLYEQAMTLFEKSGIEACRMDGDSWGICLDPSNPRDKEWYENDDAYSGLVDLQ